MDHIKMDMKTDVQGLYKTPEGSLINKDNDALLAYKKRKQKDRKVEIIEEELKELKSDITEIKELLRSLIK